MTELAARIRDIPIPERMARLPVSAKGFPVPWFVDWNDKGEPDFRAVDGRKLAPAVRQRLCWLCGEPLGRHLAFVIGPMCMVNRVTSEPPSHADCARYAVKACPFLTQPRARRNIKDLPENREPAAGFHFDRNPGVTAIWICEAYKPFRAQAGNEGVLFRIGQPERVEFYTEGRTATRVEILASIDSGMPLLRAAAAQEGREAREAMEVLTEQYGAALRLLPAA